MISRVFWYRGLLVGRGGRRKRFVGQAWYVGRLYNNNTIPPSRACPAPLTRVFFWSMLIVTVRRELATSHVMRCVIRNYNRP